MEFVAYYRVSTAKQGHSGLGLEAQRMTIEQYAKSKGSIIAEFTEIESGKNNKRPNLLAAIQCAKNQSATLIIAKLDRLSRNVQFISTLIGSDLDFVCCDMPEANKLTLHIFAAMAEYERDMISKRTKDALAAHKARGGTIGNPLLQDKEKATIMGYHAAAAKWKNYKSDIPPMTIELAKQYRNQGFSFQAIADKLTELGCKTHRNKQISPTFVLRILK